MSCIFLIILSSIASYFITFMNLYGFFMPPWSSLCFSGEVFFLLFVPFINHDKKGRNCGFFFFFLKILHVRGRNTCLCKGELCFILLRGVPTFFFVYIGLVTMFTYIVLIFDIYIYDDVCFFHLPLLVLFLFSLYTHVSLLYAIFYFCFTLRCLDEFCFKVFQKYRLSKSTCHKLFSCKVFQEFVIG